jgi:hypothetical protein
MRSSRDHIQSLDYRNNAIVKSSGWADGVQSWSIADDSLVVNIPLDGSEASNPALPVEYTLQKVAQPSSTTASKRRRLFKPRRVVPETKVYVEAYKDEDVISGRGTRANNHTGNRFYRGLVEEGKKDYRQSSKKDKRDIVDKIIKTIHGRNGQFLEMELETKRWYLSHEKMAYTKVAQALRDQNDEESRAAKRAKSA